MHCKTLLLYRAMAAIALPMRGTLLGVRTLAGCSVLAVMVTVLVMVVMTVDGGRWLRCGCLSGRYRSRSGAS